MVGIVETLKQLRAMAKTAGLIGYSRMRKDQLVDLIESKSKRKFERKEKTPTVKEFRKRPRNWGYKVMNQGTDIVEELKAIDEKFGEKIAQWTSEKSGWTLKRLICLYLNTDKYSPLKGSQYIALPKWIKDKKAVVGKGHQTAAQSISSKTHHDDGRGQGKSQKSTICWLCEESLEDDKVRDHCPFTGKYRGAAHNTCNLKHRLPRFVPVYFHNLAGYDAHLFGRNLATSEGEIRCIPNTEENYISFSKKIKVGEYEDKRTNRMKSISQDLRFVDSVKIMKASLEKIVKITPESTLTITKQIFGGEALNPSLYQVIPSTSANNRKITLR
ncbi:unnamed protein product [Mytilus edulis]|uniref:Rho termination factor-like N-terminal domain-containing protein n=1 Tax=Mytilus edulis TaxID=6550 RepID=A0A8S3TX92_MYTED|nr:unnamed protein product [Mytilus edulis]